MISVHDQVSWAGHVNYAAFVLRYDTGEAADGLPAGEGAFLACRFGLVDKLTLLGRHYEARGLSERLLGLRNDVSLLAEEYDSATRTQVGNFPQVFGHLALANSARTLSAAVAAKPAEQRSGSTSAAGAFHDRVGSAHMITAL